MIQTPLLSLVYFSFCFSSCFFIVLLDDDPFEEIVPLFVKRRYAQYMLNVADRPDPTQAKPAPQKPPELIGKVAAINKSLEREMDDFCKNFAGYPDVDVSAPHFLVNSFSSSSSYFVSRMPCKTGG